MNKFILIILTALSIFNTTKLLSQRSNIIVFLDKSSSAQESQTEQTVEKYLSKIISQEIKESGDRLSISFIYSLTSNPKNRRSFLYQPPIERSSNGNRLQKKEAKLRYLSNKKRYRQNWYKKILTYIKSNTASKTETDLHGSFTIINDMAKQNIAPNKIFYISDLIPCSPGYRYYCKGGKTINNSKETLNYARKDLKKILAEQRIDTSIFTRIEEVHLLLIQSPLSDKQSTVFMPRYWQAIFEVLQVPSVYIY